MRTRTTAVVAVLTASISGFGLAPIRASSAAPTVTCETVTKADVSTIIYPEADWFLLEGKVRATSTADPDWIKIVFIRHDGDATGGDKRAWIQGETQQLAAFHVTSGRGGRPIGMRVVSDQPICITMVQFKVVPLPVSAIVDIQKGTWPPPQPLAQTPASTDDAPVQHG